MIKLIKSFLKWRKERKMMHQYSRCRICAYLGNMKYASFCSSCMNGINDSYFTPMLRPITAEEFASIVIHNFLGKDWHVVDPLNREQVLAIALNEILKRYDN